MGGVRGSNERITKLVAAIYAAGMQLANVETPQKAVFSVDSQTEI